MALIRQDFGYQAPGEVREVAGSGEWIATVP